MVSLASPSSLSAALSVSCAGSDCAVMLDSQWCLCRTLSRRDGSEEECYAPEIGARMKRVTLFPNGSTRNGKVVAVNGSLSELLSMASSKLGINAASIYNGRGGLIDEVTLIRDDDVLYVCEEEPFVGAVHMYPDIKDFADTIHPKEDNTD